MKKWLALLLSLALLASMAMLVRRKDVPILNYISDCVKKQVFFRFRIILWIASLIAAPSVTSGNLEGAHLDRRLVTKLSARIVVHPILKRNSFYN